MTDLCRQVAKYRASVMEQIPAISQSIFMQFQVNNKKEMWQAAGTGNSPTQLATLRQKVRQT